MELKACELLPEFGVIGWSLWIELGHGWEIFFISESSPGYSSNSFAKKEFSGIHYQILFPDHF